MLKMKISTTKEGTIVALCDSELLGKVLKEGKNVLDLEKYACFYNGFEIDERSAKTKQQVEIALKYSKSINVVGKKAVDFIKELGYKTEGAKMIAKVPHLQIYHL